MSKEDQLNIYLVKDNVTGKYAVSSRWWDTSVSSLSTKNNAHVFSTTRSANTLKNKLIYYVKRDGEHLEKQYLTGATLSLKDGDRLDDWNKRKNLVNIGFEMVTLTV